MTTFEILTTLGSGIGLLSSIFIVYLKLKVDIAKIETRLNAIDRELIQKELTLLLIEKNNREDHKSIIEKIDDILSKLSHK